MTLWSEFKKFAVKGNMVDLAIGVITIFIVVRFLNSLQDKAEDESNTTVPTPKDIQLLAEIRDGINQLNGAAPKKVEANS